MPSIDWAQVLGNAESLPNSSSQKRDKDDPFTLSQRQLNLIQYLGVDSEIAYNDYGKADYSEHDQIFQTAHAYKDRFIEDHPGEQPSPGTSPLPHMKGCCSQLILDELHQSLQAISKAMFSKLRKQPLSIQNDTFIA